MIFAFGLFALLAAVGLAVEMSRTLTERERLQKASDVAALAATRAALNYLNTNGYSTSNAATASTRGVAAAEAAFTGNLSGTPIASSAALTTTVTVTSASAITTSVSSTASVETTLLGLFGVSPLQIVETSTATNSSSASYFQFVFLVDVSGSMTIGGSTANNTLLTSTYYSYFKDSTQCIRNKTSFSACAFACHDPNNIYPCSTYPDKKTRRVTAANLGVKLKIDYVKSAIATFISTANSSMTSANFNAIASIYTFGTSFTALSSNVSLSTAKTAASSIQIETIDASNNWGYTNTTAALTKLAAKLTNVGDGSSATARRTYVVFVTDGLEDTSGSCSNYGRCTGVGYTSACTKVKNIDTTNLTFISIEATYPVVSGDTQYTTIVAPYTTAMKTAMAACATSSSWYFSADDGSGIETAMASAIDQITSTIRLSK